MRARGAWMRFAVVALCFFSWAAVSPAYTVEVPGSVCGDGTQSFFSVTERPEAKNLMVFLNPGGACWSAGTCDCVGAKCFGGLAVSGLTRVSPNSVGNWKNGRGWRNASDPLNPVAKDFNIVEIPYCTGDVFTGTHTVTYGQATIHHKGHDNLRLMMAEILARFPSPEKILFMGSSAGGLGVLFNAPLVKSVYPETPLYIYSDSGTPYKAPYIDADSFDKILGHWGTLAALPEGFDSGEDQNADLGDMIRYVLGHYEDTRYAFVSSLDDWVMNRFAEAAGSQYKGRLVYDLIRDVAKNDIAGHPRAQVFFVRGSNHMFYQQRPSSVVSVGTALSTWVEEMFSSEEGVWKSVRPDLQRSVAQIP